MKDAYSRCNVCGFYPNVQPGVCPNCERSSCSWHNQCSSSFCDCGPCGNVECKTCYPGNCACVFDSAPCKACIAGANWTDADSEGAGGDGEL